MFSLRPTSLKLFIFLDLDFSTILLQVTSCVLAMEEILSGNTHAKNEGLILHFRRYEAVQLAYCHYDVGSSSILIINSFLVI